MERATDARGRLRAAPITCALAVLFMLVAHGRASAQWATSGNNINTTNTGNVGVGTANPQEKIHVSGGGVRIDAPAAQSLTIAPSAVGGGLVNGVDFLAGPGGDVRIGAFNSSNIFGGAAFQLFSDSNAFTPGQIYFDAGKSSNAALIFRTGYGATEAMRIVKSGNVGFGTATPGEALTVAGRGAIGNVNSHTLLYSTFDAQGNYVFELGNGTAHSAVTPYPAFVLSNNTTSTDNSAGIVGQLVFANRQIPDGSDKRLAAVMGWVDGAVNSGTLQFYTMRGGAFGERMRITSGGNVGIGTTNPQKALDVVGDINVSGNINAKYQDVAEWVSSSQKLLAGTVVVLDAGKSNYVMASTKSYDTGVAGVVSARPGIALGEGGEGKLLVATTGRVRVKVDAARAPIRVGDLLVTSDVKGVAMKSIPVDLGGTPIHRPGTIVGKALEPLEKGTGEILVLLSLQ